MISFADQMAALQGQDDTTWPLFHLAVALALEDDPTLDLGPALSYGDALPARVRQERHDLIAHGAEDQVGTYLAALKHVIVDQDGMNGDTETYDDPANSLLPHVITRKKGIPITLAILYLHAARACGFNAHGLNFPGHFLLRLEHAGQVLIVDVFNHCHVLAAPDLRRLIKTVAGPGAELSADYYVPVGPRAVLIRLQNNIKLRHIARGDYHSAVRVIERMRLIDPDEHRLLLDAGVMYAKLQEPTRARPLLQQYLATLPPRHPHRVDAEMLLHELEGLI